MAAPRNRKHILVPGPPTAEAYKPHGRKMDVTKPAPPTSRGKHGKALERALKAAVVEANKRRDSPDVFRFVGGVMLTSLEIKNFKGIAARQLIDFAPLTLLFDTNGAGKRNV